MQHLTLLPGKLLVTRDPDQVMHADLIHLPDVEHRRAVTGYVHHHRLSEYWPEDEPLVQQRVMFEKYAWRRLELQGHEFHVIDERSVLAVLPEGALPEPIGARVVVELVPPEAVTQSGLVIPDRAKDPQTRGRVVAVGGGIADLAVGEIVLFGRFAGEPLALPDGRALLVLHTADLVAAWEAA